MVSAPSKLKVLQTDDPSLLKNMLIFDKTVFTSKIPSIKDLMFSLRVDDVAATQIHQSLLILAPLIMSVDSLSFHSLVEIKKNSHAVSLEVHGVDFPITTSGKEISSLAIVHFLCHHPAARDFQHFIPEDLRNRLTNTELASLALEDEDGLKSVFSHGLKAMLNNVFGSFCLTITSFCLALAVGYFDAEIFTAGNTLRFMSQLHTINPNDNLLNAGFLYASLVRTVVSLLNESLANLGPFENPYTRSVILCPGKYPNNLTPGNAFSCIYTNYLLNESFDKSHLQIAITDLCSPTSSAPITIAHPSKDFTKTLERTCSRFFNDIFKTSVDWPTVKLAPESYLPRVTCKLLIDELPSSSQAVLLVTNRPETYREDMQVDLLWESVQSFSSSSFIPRTPLTGVCVETPAGLPVFSDSPSSMKVALNPLPEPPIQIDCLSIPVYQSFTPEYKITSNSFNEGSPTMTITSPTFMDANELNISSSQIFSFSESSFSSQRKSRGKLRSIINARTASTVNIPAYNIK